jgi:uncharacterized protein (DUF1800 family)
MKLLNKLIKLISQVLFISCLIFFLGCKTPEDASVETSKQSSDTNNDDETSNEIASRCEFATSNISQASIEADNQSQKAFRLLLQSTFGPQKKDLDKIIQIGESAWIDEQLQHSSAYDVIGDNLSTNLEHYKKIALMAEPSTYSDNASFNNNFHGRTSDYQTAAWFEKALHAPDQLRYRVAFALSELLVVSGAKQRTRFRGDSLAYYDDILAKNTFGNFRDLLNEVSLSPAMGIFLSHQGNKKFMSKTKTHPDENFAREVMQLFSLGLWKMHDNGSAVESGGDLVPAYTQEDVEQLARVMTGYDLVGNSNYGKTHRGAGEEWSTPMEFTGSWHDFDNKSFLSKSVSEESDNASSPTDFKNALDIIFNHKNVGPHVAKHLIMRLVTSNPSAAYIERVAQKFNDNGSGVRGELKAVVKAVLTDDEARGTEYQTNKNFGKAKEPLLAWTQFLRAFDVKPIDGWKSRDNATMSNTYNFPWMESILGQAPLRSDTVFNFFSPDFVPANDHFSESCMVAPDLQIQSDTILIKFNNYISNAFQMQEKNKILDKGQTIESFGQSRKSNHFNYYINVDEELAVFEQALDGDQNGDFQGLTVHKDPKKTDAIDALLIHLDVKLTGGILPTSYHGVIKDHLLTVNWNSSRNKTEALAIIRDAVMLIVTSSQYMIQK